MYFREAPLLGVVWDEPQEVDGCVLEAPEDDDWPLLFEANEQKVYTKDVYTRDGFYDLFISTLLSLVAVTVTICFLAFNAFFIYSGNLTAVVISWNVPLIIALLNGWVLESKDDDDFF